MRRRLFALAAALAPPAFALPGFAQPGAPPAGARPPAAGGTLRVALGGGLTHLDPALAASGAEHVYVNLVFNGLTRIDRDMTVRPDLAESWTASADLTSWTFRLRDKVTFQHGRRLDAGDVVASITRLLEAGPEQRGRSGLDVVTGVEALDPRSVRFTLTAPYAGFADIFAAPQLRIVPRDRLAELASAPVGTGPFMLRRFAPGSVMELARNPGYFEPGLPRLEAVHVQIVPEAAARLAALDSGAADLLWNLPYEAVERYRGSASVRTDAVPTAAWDAVVLHNGMRPFNDQRVRLALAASIDKDMLVEKVLSGQGAPTHSPIPPGSPYYDGKLGYPAPDLARARRLLAEAGYPNGIDIAMQVPLECDRRIRLGAAVRDMARPAGFRIVLERVSLANYPARVWGRRPMFVDGAWPSPGVSSAVFPYFHSGGWWNGRLWNYDNARVDELLALGRGTTEEAKRADIFRAYQAIMEQTAPGIIAYAAMHVNGLRRNVQNFHSSAMAWLDLKEVWIDAG